MTLLLVGGIWNDETGERSERIQNLFKTLTQKHVSTVIINGGNYDHLDDIINESNEFDAVLWLPDTLGLPDKINDLTRVYNNFIVSYHNTGDFNLIVTKNKNTIILSDGLSIEYYRHHNFEDFVDVLIDRLKFLVSTNKIKLEENTNLNTNNKNISKSQFKTLSARENNAALLSENNDTIITTRECYNNISSPGKPPTDRIHAHLYDMFPNINYIARIAEYIQNAPFTKDVIPIGTTEELSAIQTIIIDNDADFDKNLYLINMKGSGGLILSETFPANIDIQNRKVPEKIKERIFIISPTDNESQILTSKFYEKLISNEFESHKKYIECTAMSPQSYLNTKLSTNNHNLIISISDSILKTCDSAVVITENTITDDMEHTLETCIENAIQLYAVDEYTIKQINTFANKRNYLLDTIKINCDKWELNLW